MMRPVRFVAVFWFCMVAETALPMVAWSQTPPGAVQDDEATLQPVEPDFTLINLPTTLRLPLHKSNFHLTHRFHGNLRAGSFGHQASNLFGLDTGAAIGFEYR